MFCIATRNWMWNVTVGSFSAWRVLYTWPAMWRKDISAVWWVAQSSDDHDDHDMTCGRDIFRSWDWKIQFRQSISESRWFNDRTFRFSGWYARKMAILHVDAEPSTTKALNDACTRMGNVRKIKSWNSCIFSCRFHCPSRLGGIIREEVSFPMVNHLFVYVLML